MTRRLQIIIVAVIAVIFFLSTMIFVVDEREQALVTAFGQPKEVIQEPGLHFKLPPPFNSIRRFEDRILPLETSEREVLALDQRRLVVDAFARWRIVDPLKFYQSVNTIRAAESRLETNLNTALREVLGNQPFDALLTGERSIIMESIREITDRSADEYGVKVVDVRVRRADLPQQNLEATYQRMQTERQREAADFRARGQEAARRTRAEADREAVELVAEAKRESEIIRGQTDAERNRIVAEEFQQDPEFFSFYRSLVAYERALAGDGTTMVMAPDSDFFSYFKDQSGPAVPAAE